jgi:hypothetical protein
MAISQRTIAGYRNRHRKQEGTMGRIGKFAAACLITAGAAGMATAQELPAKSIYEAMLTANKASGWVAFRNFNGNQLLYFTPLQTMHCRLSEIRYSINSGALDQRFELVPCNKQMPFAMPSDVAPERIYLTLPPGTAETVTVQVVWDDGQESEILTFKPCDNVGESTCAAAVE